jgi:hypothetical protein
MAAWARSASLNGRTASSVPWMIRVGAWTRARSSATGVRYDHSDGGDEDLGRGPERPRHPVLAGLRRVRLGEGLGHEELEELAVVRAPVMGVVLGPPLVAVPWLEELRTDEPALVQGHPRQDQPVDPLRVVRGEDGARPRAAREADERRALDARRVEDGAGLVGDPVVVIPGRGPVGAAVARRVEREGPEVAGEVGDLQLPDPAVDDLPGGHEEDRAGALAVLLPEDPRAVRLHVAFAVRLACTHGGDLPRAARR